MGPNGQTSGRGKRYTWIAPATADSTTITFSQGEGKTQTLEMQVIAPNGLDFWKRNEEQFAANTQGAGMWTSVRMLPFTVSFARTSWKEIPGPPSNMQGYLSLVRRRSISMCWQPNSATSE